MATRKTRLYKIYRENQAAHKYLLGCIYKGGLYLCYMDDIPPRMIQCDKKGLRMRVYTKKDIAYIVKRGFYVGPASLLDSDIYNKGVMLEQVVYNIYQQEWKRNNTPFYKDGDITINGKKVQIKYSHGHIAYSTTLERLAAC